MNVIYMDNFHILGYACNRIQGKIKMMMMMMMNWDPIKLMFLYNIMDQQS
jgi:hypothetical protein